MSQYTPVTNFLSKDSLVSGNALKALKGAELSTEFAAVQTAVNSKPDGAAQFFPDGNATQPSVGFTNNAGTGMFNVAGVLSWATGGVLRATLSAAGLLTALFGLTVSGGAFTSRGIADNATANAMTLDSAGNVNVPNGAGTQSPVYAGIPQNIQNGNYTTVLSDANKHLYKSSGAGNTILLAANASVAYPLGTAITIVNNSGSTVSISSSDNFLWAVNGSTSGRVLANFGQLTALKILATTWQISGTGVS